MQLLVKRPGLPLSTAQATRLHMAAKPEALLPGTMCRCWVNENVRGARVPADNTFSEVLESRKNVYRNSSTECANRPDRKACVVAGCMRLTSGTCQSAAQCSSSAQATTDITRVTPLQTTRVVMAPQVVGNNF